MQNRLLLTEILQIWAALPLGSHKSTRTRICGGHVAMELTPVSSFCALGSSSANASGGSMAAAEIDELFSTSHFAPVPARITPR